MSVEAPLVQRVSLGHPDNPFSDCMFIRKDIFIQEIPDFRDPCVGTILSNWILRAGVYGAPCDTYDP